MMQFDRDVLIAKLAQLQDLIARIENKRPSRLDLLLVDRDAQDILSKNIERSVQVCVDIATHVATANGFAPTTSGDAFLILSDHQMLDRDLANAMIKAVGFRNVAVHEYVKIDWAIVMDIATDGINDLKAFGCWTKDLVCGSV